MILDRFAPDGDFAVAVQVTKYVTAVLRDNFDVLLGHEEAAYLDVRGFIFAQHDGFVQSDFNFAVLGFFDQPRRGSVPEPRGG